MKKNGFIISTTLYSVFGIMLFIVFYIMFILASNRTLINSSITDIKDEINEQEDCVLSY